MPSNKDPKSAINAGAGKLPAGVVPAGALLFPPGAGENAALQAHLIDPVGAHASTAISATNTGNFADGNPAVGTEVQGLVNDVVALLGATAGAAKVGSVNTGNFADGNPATGAAVQSLINDVVAKLAATTGGAKVGGAAYAPVGHWTLAAAALTTQLNDLLDKLNYQYSSRAITVADSITVNDGTIILNPGAAFNLTLPAAAAFKGQRINLIALDDGIGTKPVTLVQTGAGVKINGATANFKLRTPRGRWILVSDGTDWYVYEQPVAAEVSVGDGVESFGDFNGADAIDQVLNYWQTVFATVASLRVHVKHGTYTMTTPITLWGAGLELTLYGDGRKDTVINASSGSYVLQTIPNTQMTFEDLSLVGNGTTWMTIRGSIRAKRCRFETLPMWFAGGTPLKVATHGPDSYFAICEDCEFDAYSGVAGMPWQFYLWNAGTATQMHKGFSFNRCTFRNHANGDAIMCVKATATTATWQDICFTQCRFDLGGVVSTGANTTGRGGGLIYVDPAGLNERVTVTNLTYDQCDVLAANANSCVFLHLFPLAHDAGALTARSYLGTVTIRGGIWTAAGVGSDFVPIFLQCAMPIVQDVQFRGSGFVTNAFNTTPQFRGNGFYTTTMKIALRGLAHNITATGEGAGWATISASGSAVEAYTTKPPSGLVVRNVTFSNFARMAGPAGPVTLQGPSMMGGPVQVDGVYIDNPIVGINSNATLVSCWVHLIPGGVGSTDRGSKGTFKSISFASAATGAVGTHWAGQAFIGISAEGYLVLDDAHIHPGGEGADPCGGTTHFAIRFYYPWDDAAQTGVGGPIYVKRAHFSKMCWGIGNWGDVGASRTTAGPYHIDEARSSVANGATNSYQLFIALWQPGKDPLPFTITNCDFEVTGLTNAIGSIGIKVQSNRWKYYYPFSILNNRVRLDWGAGDPGAGTNWGNIVVYAYDDGALGTVITAGNILNNRCVVKIATFDLVGQIQVSKGNNLALTDPGVPAGSYVRGVETGIVGGVNPIVDYRYQNNTTILTGNLLAKLITPCL